MNKEAAKDNTLAITSITCNRPELLAASLASITRQAEAEEISVNITVFDDSPDNETQEKNRKIVDEAKRNTPHTITYSGIKEKETTIRTLSEQAGRTEKDTELLKFAVFGNSTINSTKGPGGNRNAALLASAGKRFISLDDDARMRFISRTGSENSLETRSGTPDLQFTPMGKWKQLEKTSSPYTANALADFDTLLGSDSTKLQAHAPDTTAAIEAPVKAVMAGIYGGRWYSRPFGIFFLDNELRGEVFRKKRSYENAKFNPINLMHAPKTVLTTSPHLISTLYGADGREILPPFPPHIRNEDTIWGLLLKMMYPDSLTAHLPYAVYHDASGKAPFTEDDFTCTGGDTGLMISLIVGDIGRRIYRLSPEKVLERTGDTLIGLSRLSYDDWIEYLRSLWLAHAGKTCTELERLLEKYKGKPSHWAQDAEEFMQKLRLQSLEESPYLLKESYREYLHIYGKLLTAWPTIWQSAQELNGEGERL